MASFENENVPPLVSGGVPEMTTGGIAGVGSVRGVSDAYENYMESLPFGEHEGDDVFNPYRLTSVPAVMNFSIPPHKNADADSDGAEEVYTLEELSTLWELTVESETGTGMSWSEKGRWLRENFHNIIEPLKNTGEVNVESLREELVRKVESFTRAREFARYLFSEMRTVTNEKEEIFYLKTLATV